jgi:SAM-dependent methyltransferase
MNIDAFRSAHDPRKRLHSWLRKPLSKKVYSVIRKVIVALSWLEDVLFEKLHRVDFSGYIDNRDLITTHTKSQTHACFYQAIMCSHIRELMREAIKTGIAFENFVDLGSGKGKACFYAATKYKFKHVLGIEFSEMLVKTANQNKELWSVGNITFLNADAATYELPKGNNLIFMFNPFDEFILAQFIEGNIENFKQNKNVVAYANDHHRLCMAKLGFATVYRNQNSSGSLYQYM